MKNNKFVCNEKVRLIATGEIVSIKNFSYVSNMKRYAYTLNEYPQSFYFEEEIKKEDKNDNE